MSVIDTPPVRTTETLSLEKVVTDWATLRMQIDAKRAVQLAAHRRQAQPAPKPTAAELRLRLSQYNGWLDTTYVQNHGALAEWVKQQKGSVLRQLADLEAGAR